jgi:hypothetical protein
MKKAITITLTALSALLILDSFGVWHAIAMFFLAGEIPGTRTSVSADTMLSIFALLFGFVLARLVNHIILFFSDYATLKRAEQQA